MLVCLFYFCFFFLNYSLEVVFDFYISFDTGIQIFGERRWFLSVYVLLAFLMQIWENRKSLKNCSLHTFTKTYYVYI